MVKIPVTPTVDNQRLLDLLPPVVNCCVAGGAARELFMGKDFENDVDVFFFSQDIFDTWCNHLKKYPAKETEYAITYTLPYKDETIPVQLVSWNYWKDVEEVFSDFDFTICQFAYTCNTVYATVESLRDLARGTLQWNNIKTGVGAVQRAFKYQNKGFTLGNDEIKKLLNYLYEHPQLIEKDWKGE